MPADPLDAQRWSPAPEGHALLIQVARYQDSSLDLPEVSDAADLAAMLGDPARCGFPPEQVKLVEDDEATGARVIAALHALVENIGEDATVFLYFSGHGGQVGGRTYLLPYDADRADLPGTAITAESLAKHLGALRARRVVLIFDCCHAGGFQARDATALPVVPGLSGAARDLLTDGRGWAVIASCDEGERSYVKAGERNGVFTKHLLGALAGNRPSTDGYVSVFDLYEYTYAQVVLERADQRPVFKCELRTPFRVAKHGGGLQPPPTASGFLYDVVLCYARADAGWVKARLIPDFVAAGLKVATTNSIADLGTARIVGLERGFKQAQRVVVVVSHNFLRPAVADDAFADNAALQTRDADIRSGRYSLIPVYIEDPDTMSDVPGWLQMLVGVRLAGAAGFEYDEDHQMHRLISALKRPVPRRQ